MRPAGSANPARPANGRFVRLLSGGSAVIFLFALAIWVRSYRAADLLSWQRPHGKDGVWHISQYGLWTSRGRLGLYHHGYDFYTGEATVVPSRLSHNRALPDDAVVRLAPEVHGGLGFMILGGYWGPGSRCLVLPLWFPALLCAVLPLSRAAARLRAAALARHRGRRGRCRRCGYDLTGNKSGKCSECGEAVV